MLDLIDRQAQLETEMMNLGKERFDKLIGEAREYEKEGVTPYGKEMLAKVIQPLAQAITQFCEQGKGKAGRRHIAIKYFQKLDPEVAAFIIAKTIIDKISAKRKLHSVKIAIATALEDECRFTQFRTQYKALFDTVLDNLKRQTTQKNNEQAVRDRMVRVSNTLENKWKAWPPQEKTHLGAKAVELFIDVTQWVEVFQTQEGKNHTENYLVATEYLNEFINNKLAFCEMLDPQFLPTVIEPKPWASIKDGGYHFLPDYLRPTIVKTRNKRYLEEINANWDDITIPVRALNALQATRWQVNTAVMEVAQQMWKRRIALAGIPDSDDLPLPPKPIDIETNEEARKAWRKEAHATHEVNIEMRSKRLAVLKTLDVAAKFQDCEAIYFPHTFDWRGRAYPLPMWLQPQGNDLARGLLRFTEGKPLITESGIRWFQVHGANTYGVDKLPFEDRLKWVTDNHGMIMSVAANPDEDFRWTEADSPFQFLAWAFEYAEWMQNPNFKTHIPVAMDGTCNGLQHWSAILRDSIGGTFVNLIPGDRPQDIYRRVADLTVLELKAIAESDSQDKDFATIWLNWGVDRGIAKRPVMIVPYSGTIFSCRDYIEEAVLEAKDKRFPIDRKKDRARWNAAMHFLAKVMWRAIGDTVIAARVGMDWMTKLARVAAEEGLPVVWKTPVGLPIQQAYPEIESRRVKTKLGNSIIYVTLNTELPRIDKKKQASGIAPNFIHSNDAAAMQLYVCKCLDAGITSFALIHDSYGVLAPDVEVSNALIREAFIALYKDNDVLEKLRQEVVDMVGPEKAKRIPPVPMKGDLDIDVVRNSRYFFA